MWAQNGLKLWQGGDGASNFAPIMAPNLFMCPTVCYLERLKNYWKFVSFFLLSVVHREVCNQLWKWNRDRH